MNLSDRMKRYEFTFRYYLPVKNYVIIRIDGRAFHTLTRRFDKPFDKLLMDVMVNSMIETAKELQGFLFAYTQSDEVSFLINDLENQESQGWFDYNLNKIVSLSASIFTMNFNHLLDCGATFDSRAFIIPKDDVPNYFIWRHQDWVRNSLNMYCQSFFSHKQLEGKNSDQRHELLYSIGKNWAEDLTERQKNGTFLLKSLFPFWFPFAYNELSWLIFGGINEEKDHN